MSKSSDDGSLGFTGKSLQEILRPVVHSKKMLYEFFNYADARAMKELIQQRRLYGGPVLDPKDFNEIGFIRPVKGLQVNITNAWYITWSFRPDRDRWQRPSPSR